MARRRRWKQIPCAEPMLQEPGLDVAKLTLCIYPSLGIGITD